MDLLEWLLELSVIFWQPLVIGQLSVKLVLQNKQVSRICEYLWINHLPILSLYRVSQNRRIAFLYYSKLSCLELTNEMAWKSRTCMFLKKKKKKRTWTFFDIRHFPFIEVTERTLYENTCFVLRKLFKGKLHSIFLSTRHEHSSTCYQQWRQSLECLSCIFEDASS